MIFEIKRNVIAKRKEILKVMGSICILLLVYKISVKNLVPSQSGGES